MTKPLEGILVINKPQGMTSHAVVARVRRILGIKKVGHAGTLDPLATGVLVVLVGRSTKLFEKFVAFDKAYRATFLLGKKTDSADIEGKVLVERPYDQVDRSRVEEAFVRFTGVIQQVPPMVSAVKKGGRKLYELARQGVEVPREPREVRIDQLTLRRFEPPEVEFYVECSKGTYVRQIADDVGEALGCGACISQIERTKVGPFTLDKAIDLQDCHERHLRHWTG